MDQLKQYEQDTTSAVLRNDNPKNIILNFYDMQIAKFITQNFISQDVNAGFIPTSSLITLGALVLAKKSIIHPDLATDKKFYDQFVRIQFLKDSLKSNNLDRDEDEKRYLSDVFELMDELSMVQSLKYMPTRRDVRINIRGDPVKTKVDDW